MELTKFLILGGALLASASPVPTSSTLPYIPTDLESLLTRMLTEHDIGQQRDVQEKGEEEPPPPGLLSNGKGGEVVIGPGGSMSVQSPTGEDGRGGVGFDGKGSVNVQEPDSAFHNPGFDPKKPGQKPPGWR